METGAQGISQMIISWVILSLLIISLSFSFRSLMLSTNIQETEAGGCIS
jgi:hypothetical protein